MTCMRENTPTMYGAMPNLAQPKFITIIIFLCFFFFIEPHWKITFVIIFYYLVGFSVLMMHCSLSKLNIQYYILYITFWPGLIRLPPSQSSTQNGKCQWLRGIYSQLTHTHTHANCLCVARTEDSTM